nr:hydroxymethylglutaryl-CoA synthase [Anaerolineae bacterium]
GQRILVTSFGSGAGSDSFCLRVLRTPNHNGAVKTRDYVTRRKAIDYAQYTRLKGYYKLN